MYSRLLFPIHEPQISYGQCTTVVCRGAVSRREPSPYVLHVSRDPAQSGYSGGVVLSALWSIIVQGDASCAWCRSIPGTCHVYNIVSALDVHYY